MDRNCASTLLIVYFLAESILLARSDAKVDLALEYIDFLTKNAITLAVSEGGIQINLNDLGSLTIDASGCITGQQLQRILRSVHLTALSSFGAMWDSMLNLTLKWDDEPMSFLDYVHFTLLVTKARRQQGKKRWVGRNKACLDHLWDSLIKFLSGTCDLFVFKDLSLYLDKAIPSRISSSRRGAGQKL